MAVENGMPEQEDVKKKAMLRLAVAGVITAAALAGLWWLDQGDDKTQSPPAQRPAPAPIVPAPAPVAPAPLTEEDTDAATPPGVDDMADDPDPAFDDAMPSEPPPPPRVSNQPRATPPAPQPAPTIAAPAPRVPPSPAATPSGRAASPAPAPLPPPPASPPAAAGGGYVVQLGVFSNPDNAREMVDRLNRQGIRAQLEARVHVGPFLDRREAEKAQAELRRLGYTPLVTTAAPTR